MKRILNIHGFDSHGDNSKKRWLEKLFPSYEIISPTLPPVPERAEEILQGLLLEESFDLIIGSSLGGFYAWYLSQVYEIPAILLNPALNPFYDLRRRLGRGVNPKTGLTYYFEESDLKHLTRMFARVYPADYPYFKIFISNNDEILKFSHIEEVYKDHLTIDEYGSHRFEKVDLIEDSVKAILNNKKCIFNEQYQQPS